MATFTTINAELVDQFVAVTGAGHNVAISLLEACAGNLDMAVGMHMDSAAAGPSHSPARGGDTLSTGIGDGVRAPIPQKTEVLVEEDSGSKLASWRLRRARASTASVFDGFRNFQTEAYDYEDSLRGKRPSKRRNLEDLFRPPVDITFKGTFQNARDAGSSQNKWLLVNVQNVQEFPCQLLNRDVWSSADARNIIQDSFIFWQVYHDSEEGKRFMQFYKVTHWPYVAIIDPLTGENQVVWTKICDGLLFCDLAKDFLNSCPVPDPSLLAPVTKRLRRDPSLVDATEQEQMEAAIQASLEEDKGIASSPQYVLDSDSEAGLLEDSDEVETFSDSDDVIVTSPPGPSASSLGQTSSGKANFSSKSERLKNLKTSSASQLSATSSSQPTSSPNVASCPPSHSSWLSPSSSSSPPDQETNSSSGRTHTSIWAASASSQLGPASPLEVTIESTLIAMIGCREAEVCTPEICTLDDSPSNSQLSVTDGELTRQPMSPISGQQSLLDNRCSTNQSSQGNNNWTDGVSKIILRFPDNKREQIELPASSQLLALTDYCSSQGYSTDKYELVTNFPRRKLSQMDNSTTLKQAGLYPQETVFVQDL